ncbi:hypothetical protein [Candidatus Phytoplasma pruni]|uniref:Uncharacterized protein n=1 Tax=Candidatus Phytoplasma pruni TaxID=479893 RepID=A0A851H9G2_9MOLU|nr:hypothetical protein [Candidatus Phytoplasma pruni]NWN45572.1 hypothetical protein [Candidatus Phytoplasma pruni]
MKTNFTDLFLSFFVGGIFSIFVYTQFFQQKINIDKAYALQLKREFVDVLQRNKVIHKNFFDNYFNKSIERDINLITSKYLDIYL